MAFFPSLGVVQLNGAAARLGHAGDHAIVISYADDEEAELTPQLAPKPVFVDERNRIKR